MAKIYKTGNFIGWNGTGWNSVAVVDGDFVSITAGFVTKAGTTGEIVGAAAGAQTMAVDNETVANAKIEYIKADEFSQYEIAATAALVKADEGKYYNLDANQVVDVATASAVKSTVDTAVAGIQPVITLQVQLIKFVDQNTSIYAIIK